MNTKKFLNNEEALSAIFEGTKRVYENVKSTMGPGGRTVIIQRPNGMPFITKDGVTVAKETVLEDPFESMAAEILKQSSIKTAEEAGDGTTTTIVLAHNILSLGLNALKEGKVKNIISFKKGIEYSAKIAVEKLKSKAREIKSEEDLLNIARISSNGDNEISELVTKAFNVVKCNGLVNFELNNNEKDELIIQDGFNFRSGYMSPYFSDKKEIVLTNPKILLTDDTINVDILNTIMSDKVKYNEPLLIITEKLPSDILTLLVNFNKKGYPVIAVTAPGFGNNKLDYYNFIAKLTNGVFLPKDAGGMVNYNFNVYGTCNNVKITNNKTVLLGTSGDVSELVEDLKNAMEKAESDYDRNIIREKIAMLTQSIVTIKAGGRTEAEAIERKDRIEDAFYAVKSAEEMGIVPGGGKTLFDIGIEIDKLEIEQDESFKLGVRILSKTLSKPMRILLDNSCVSKEELEDILKDKVELFALPDYGLNINTREVVNLFEEGIIDPVKVEISAILNAVSSATTLLTTNCCIVLSKEPMGYMTVQ